VDVFFLKHGVCTDGQTFGPVLLGHHRSNKLKMLLLNLQWCINIDTSIYQPLPCLSLSATIVSGPQDSSEDSLVVFSQARCLL